LANRFAVGAHLTLDLLPFKGLFRVQTVLERFTQF